MSAPVLFVRRFTVLDYARVIPGGFEGDSVYVHAELVGELDERGFLADFGPIKRVLKALVDDCLDHRLAVPTRLPGIKLENQGDELALGVCGGTDEPVWDYCAPRDAFALVDAEMIDDDALCDHLAAEAREILPANVKSVNFSMSAPRELDVDPSFRYTHGLKLHDGHCQRLMHGHRNIIEVRIDGRDDRDAATLLARYFDGVHFAHREDVRRGVEDAELSCVSIGYNAMAGWFCANLPAQRVHLLSVEPTIENIATSAYRWLARRLSLDPKRLTILAYEGLHKGAAVGQGFTC